MQPLYGVEVVAYIANNAELFPCRLLCCVSNKPCWKLYDFLWRMVYWLSTHWNEENTEKKYCLYFFSLNSLFQHLLSIMIILHQEIWKNVTIL